MRRLLDNAACFLACAGLVGAHRPVSSAHLVLVCVSAGVHVRSDLSPHVPC